MSQLQTYFALQARHKVLLLRAWCMLGWYRGVMLLLPLRRLTASLQHHASAVPAVPLGPGQLEEALVVGRLVSAAARVTPWQSLCLAQVLVVQRFLARRNIPGQFYLGVSKGEEPGAGLPGFAAHAWLQCEDTVISGTAGHEQFTVVSTFSWG